jgi:pimeloyl-ACP methyl ester carboxylesterase
MMTFHKIYPCSASILIASFLCLIGQSDGVHHEIVRLTAEDGGRSQGVLHTSRQGKADVVLVAMHPRSDQTDHFTLTPAAKRGMAGFGIAGRYVHREPFIIKEELMLDIAAAIRYLRDERGYGTVVLIAHSGGGPLLTMYQSQANTKAPMRITSTPAGDPPNLNAYDLPAADALITLASHEGEGIHNEHRLDPAVVDESNPYLVDASIDMYNPANGYRFPPVESRYSPDFLERFRAAQKARAHRLDTLARSLIQQQKHYKELMTSPSFKEHSLEERLDIERRAAAIPMMIIYGTEAEPRYMDMSLDPSDRLLGSNTAGDRPDLRNRAPRGASRVMTPQAYLSTRSGISSNAHMLENIARVSTPTLVLCGTADRGIYLSTTRAIYQASGAKDKKMVLIEGGDHGFRPSGPKTGKGDQRERTLNTIFEWIEERFGAPSSN